MHHRPIRLAAVGLAVLAASACGSSSSSGYGKSADPAEAKRTVDVTITQAKQYVPPSLSVARNEVVTFKVTNSSSDLHEFQLGDAKVQDAHEKEMAGMGSGSMKVADKPNLIDLDPGQTKSLTWKFPGKATTVIYGSHVPGDYTGGLKGIVTVS